MAASLLPLALALGLLLSIPHFTSLFALFAYTLALLIALRVSISAFTIPYMGLGAELSDDYDERSSIAAFRILFGIIATLITFVLGFGVFLGGAKGLLNRSGYVAFGWTSAALLLIAGVLATHASHKAQVRISTSSRADHGILGRLRIEVLEVFKNSSFRRLFGGVLVFFVGEGVVVALGLDGNKYFWALSGGQIQSIAMGTVVGLALGLPVAFVLIGRVEKMTVAIGGIAILCAAQGLPILAQLLGVLPAGIHFRVAILVSAAVVVGMVLTVVSISFPSAMADAVDEHEHLFGARREGLYFASLTFATKAALGLGSLFSGLLLDAIHFPSAAIAAGRSMDIAPSVIQHLGWVLGPAAALMTLTSLAFFSRYRLNRAAHAAILRALGRSAI
jgi:GPH family glycoside/pentoside/hexuronide:cation symporter